METSNAEEVDVLLSQIAKVFSSPADSTLDKQQSILPTLQSLHHARQRLHLQLPFTGLGTSPTLAHLRNDITPAFNASSHSSRYYGFVTGGATPTALAADLLTTLYDQNPAVHLPDETIATDLEHAALSLLCDLLRFDPATFPHRTLTSGATVSNLMGLICGREAVLAHAAERVGQTRFPGCGELGIAEAMRIAGVERVQILTTAPHSSLLKAASMAGLGRGVVVDVGRPGRDERYRFDIGLLARLLATARTASIVVVSCAEVNAGQFATSGLQEMAQIRDLCDRHGAWIHADGAFGLFGRLLTDSDSEFGAIASATAGIELADSLTGDAHKLLNVPYDSGFFLSRSPAYAFSAFQNANAAYLSTSPPSSSSNPSSDPVLSPLDHSPQNSRRLRALPLYATLLSHSRAGYTHMLKSQIRLARDIARFIATHPAYVLLNGAPSPAPKPSDDDEDDDAGGNMAGIFIIVLFRARDAALNAVLKERVNATGRVYVSRTVAPGETPGAAEEACRIAVASWMVGEGETQRRDLAVVKAVLEEVAAGFE